ncbi:MAG: fn1, partial [Phycisphaerales bacterium]|nr:fn1 [Phycisphaerales bacterium]
MPARPSWPGVEALESRQLYAAAPSAAAVPLAAAVPQATQIVGTPRVTKVTPLAGATSVQVDSAIACDVSVPNGGIDATTLTSTTVFLKRTADGLLIPAVLNTSGGGDAIVLKPENPLETSTSYTFTVTSGVKDLAGVAFTPFTSTLTTSATGIDPNVKYRFEQVDLPNTHGQQFSAVYARDNYLYAGTLTGMLYRFPINADGTLGDPLIVDTVIKHAGGPQFITGITVSPQSTPTNHILWISRTGTSGLQVGDAEGADWTGAISVITGAKMDTMVDEVVHLPRSVRDHLTNQLSFGPDKKLYFGQASNSAMGAPDVTWGNRAEHL